MPFSVHRFSLRAWGARLRAKREAFFDDLAVRLFLGKEPAVATPTPAREEKGGPVRLDTFVPEVLLPHQQLGRALLAEGEALLKDPSPDPARFCADFAGWRTRVAAAIESGWPDRPVDLRAFAERSRHVFGDPPPPRHGADPAEAAQAALETARTRARDEGGQLLYALRVRLGLERGA